MLMPKVTEKNVTAWQTPETGSRNGHRLITLFAIYVPQKTLI